MNKIYRLVEDFSEKLKQKNISIISAGTAFFFFLSLVPMVIVFCSLVPYIPISETGVITMIKEMAPQWLAPLAISIVMEVFEKSPGTLSIAALVTLYSAGKGFMGLLRGLNALHDVEERRHYVTIRFLSTFYMMVMLFAVIFSLLAILISRRLVNALEGWIPTLHRVVQFLMYFRFFVLIFVLALAFALLYTFVPDKKIVFVQQIPGALFAAAGWGAYSYGFSKYIEFADFSMYGSLAIIIIVLLWLYSCMYIVFLGAYLNIYIQEDLKKALVS